jgi:hypothetical protein
MSASSCDKTPLRLNKEVRKSEMSKVMIIYSLKYNPKQVKNWCDQYLFIMQLNTNQLKKYQL